MAAELRPSDLKNLVSVQPNVELADSECFGSPSLLPAWCLIKEKAELFQSAGFPPSPQLRCPAPRGVRTFRRHLRWFLPRCSGFVPRPQKEHARQEKLAAPEFSHSLSCRGSCELFVSQQSATRFHAMIAGLVPATCLG